MGIFDKILDEVADVVLAPITLPKKVMDKGIEIWEEDE